MSFAESVIEGAPPAWLEGLGGAVQSGLAIAPGKPEAERTDSGQVVLEGWLRHALARLNPPLPVEIRVERAL